MTTLESIAQTDYANFVARELFEKLETKASPIEIAVDTACRYDRIKEIREGFLTCLKQIVESKEVLGLDFSRENELIKILEHDLK